VSPPCYGKSRRHGKFWRIPFKRIRGFTCLPFFTPPVSCNQKYRRAHFWPGYLNSLAITALSNGPPVSLRKRNVLSAAYDILKKDSADMVWVEAVHDLETAKLRVKQLAAGSQGEYVIFDQRTRKIVANCSAVRRF
jgi:hypothetical protein